MEGKWKFALLFVALVLSGVSAQADLEKTTTTTEEPEPTTTVTTTTSTTTTEEPTTTTTTTKAPETTTTTSTTAAPPAPPTTPAPAPKPFPSNEGKWSVENATNSSCILLKGALEVSIAYVDSNNKNRTANIDVPITADSSGSCEGNQYITLSWNSTVTLKDNSTAVNSLSFYFESNSSGVLAAGTGITKDKYGLQNITGTIYKDEAFVNVTGRDTPVKFSMLNKGAFQTPLNHSYSCLAQEVLKQEDGSIALKFSDIRLEAFRQGVPDQTDFSASIDCLADDASDIVPIAVGAALAALVVIVLVAYLIGRRRSRARGYQSV